jgi:hypothetical protein
MLLSVSTLDPGLRRRHPDGSFEDQAREDQARFAFPIRIRGPMQDLQRLSAGVRRHD